MSARNLAKIRIETKLASLRDQLTRCWAWIAIEGWKLPKSCSPRAKILKDIESALAGAEGQ